MMKKTLLLLPLLASLNGLPLNASAGPQLMVTPISLKVFNQHEQRVSVRNTGDAPLYLSISLAKVDNPGEAQEHKTLISQLPHPELMATPNKLTLGPNQSRDILLTSLQEPASETVYRLYVVPVKSLEFSGVTDDKITAPVTLSVGYGVLIRHLPAPANQRTALEHRCGVNELTLLNSGNTRLLLRQVKATPASNTVTDVLALFPGTPQTLKIRQFSADLDGKPVEITCP
ncbi:pilus assembly protein [Serratia sp. PL7]|uniref:pilus assembly protein n=1 Tax=Serratia sp. PL7 TaxID=2952201 RepID=UPI0019E983F8|nr:pilus assembly protein [Serratia sp. PL7]MBE0151454.1 pilus assembly protein [Serratia fonticola]